MTTDTWKQFKRHPISHSAAHHIIAIAELRESAGYARVSDVAKLLNITRGSVSLTLKDLRQKGLVAEDDNRFLLLTETGEQVAHAVRGKKFLLQNLLHGLLGGNAHVADEDACKIEHLVSDETAERLARFLRFVGSGDERAQAFVEAWGAYNEPCDHDPEGCPACDVDCLVNLCSPDSAKSTANGSTQQGQQP
ncbi:MAG: metal-dependent transcriptional regulator [bacterium]|nr:metal-dependent transcriptional regulator [bacterium]